MANHGGGFIILGFQEAGGVFSSTACPSELPQITQDAVNESIRRYAEPEFHSQMYSIAHSGSGVTHPVIVIPGSDVPVMCRRDQLDSGVSQHKFYVRKPGPRSEEPQTAEEWRQLIDRCIRARRELLLDSIRSIILGKAEIEDSLPEPTETLGDYCRAAYGRWTELVSGLPSDSPARFPLGYYEMGFDPVGAVPSRNLEALRSRLAAAQRIQLSGWPPFLEMDKEWAPYPYDQFIEAWVGTPRDPQIWNDPFHADFWRAAIDGQLYTIRGYVYDGPDVLALGYSPGSVFGVEMPILRIAEGILFATRFAEQFVGVEQMAIRCKFTGLSGRSLVSSDPLVMLMQGQYNCQTSEVLLTRLVTLQQLRDALPEIVHELLVPLFDKFGFYKLYLNQVQTALQQMRKYQ